MNFNQNPPLTCRHIYNKTQLKYVNIKKNNFTTDREVESP